MLGSCILPAMNEAQNARPQHRYITGTIHIDSTWDISMLGSSILQAMNEAWLDVYACLCE